VRTFTPGETIESLACKSRHVLVSLTAVSDDATVDMNFMMNPFGVEEEDEEETPKNTYRYEYRGSVYGITISLASLAISLLVIYTF